MIAGLVGGLVESLLVFAAGAAIRAVAAYQSARSGQPAAWIARGAWPLALACGVAFGLLHALLTRDLWQTIFALFPLAWITAVVARRFERLPG